MQKIMELFCDTWLDTWSLHQVHQLEQQCQTPCYLFHEGKAKENIQMLRNYLGDSVEICYAVKANPWLVSILQNAVDRLDICTEGELQICIRAKADPEKILYEGPYKADAVLKRMTDYGIKRISVDSLEQWNRINELAERRPEHPIAVLLRLNSGGQFGMESSEIIELLQTPHRVYVSGLHYYAGTQRQYPWQVREELTNLENQISDIESATGRKINELEFGAGTGIPYFESDHAEDFTESFLHQAEFARRMSRQRHVIFEVGRCVSASAGAFLTKVVGKKKLHNQWHLFLNAGTNLLSYYGGMSGQRVPKMKMFCHHKINENFCFAMICGCLCTSSDIFARQKQIPDILDIGDYILFRNTGAYAPTEVFPQFLSMDFPAIMMYNERQNNWEVIRKQIPSSIFYNTKESDFR